MKETTSDWHYVSNGAPAGPVTFEKIIELLSGGELNGETKVWSDHMNDWKKVDDVPELQVQKAKKGPPPLTPDKPLSDDVPPTPDAGAESSNQWHYISGGSSSEPASKEKILDLITAGDLTTSSKVWSNHLTEWTKISDIPELLKLSSNGAPPALDAKDMKNFWFYALIVAPMIVSFILLVITESTEIMKGEYDFFAFMVVNTLLATADQTAMRRAGQSTKAKGLLIWALILIPVYVWMRARRTGMSAWPLVLWFCSVFGGGFVTEVLPEYMHFGIGTPTCESATSKSMVTDLYGQIVQYQSQVLRFAEISETSFDEANSTRVCQARAETTTGMEANLEYVITEAEGEYDYIWNLKLIP